MYACPLVISYLFAHKWIVEIYATTHTCYTSEFNPHSRTLGPRPFFFFHFFLFLSFFFSSEVHNAARVSEYGVMIVYI
ncbi:hypothetical protein HOY82DRAFT_564527 [Tuber indicum]|nr:hypothetical protein HOY82DRAFT_564527 [Tuber indicum]